MADQPQVQMMTPYERVLELLNLMEQYGTSDDPVREACKAKIRTLMREGSDMFAELTLMLVCLQVSVPDIEWTMTETLVRLKRTAADAQDAIAGATALQGQPTPEKVM